MAINVDVPTGIEFAGNNLPVLALNAAWETEPEIVDRFLGTHSTAVYLIRPDQHIVARWEGFDHAAVSDALNAALGRAP